MSEFERIIKFHAAYDRRNPDPKKNYGIHGVDLVFVLKGDKGAVQFLVFTNWHLPHVQQGLEGDRLLPMPADLGYHSPKPRFEGHPAITKACEWLDGKPCYFDGSTLNAEPVFEILLKEGSDGVWRELETYYKEIFKE